MTKRGSEKPPSSAKAAEGGMTREKTERQVMPSSFPHILADGTKVTLHKLTLDQSEELDIDVSGFFNEDGGLNESEMQRTALRYSRQIAVFATGLSNEEVGKMLVDDVLGIAAAILRGLFVDNAAVNDFFAVGAGILFPAMEIRGKLAELRTTAS
jgi:hypothetical protein